AMADEFGGPPILIVDDDEDTRFALAHLLEAEGYVTAGVATGAEALSHLRAGRPTALVILDIMLPDMSGVAVRAELKRDATLASIPVVGFSALDDDGRLPDVAAYVRKGLEIDVLLRAIARALGRPAATQR